MGPRFLYTPYDCPPETLLDSWALRAREVGACEAAAYVCERGKAFKDLPRGSYVVPFWVVEHNPLPYEKIITNPKGTTYEPLSRCRMQSPVVLGHQTTIGFYIDPSSDLNHVIITVTTIFSNTFIAIRSYL